LDNRGADRDPSPAFLGCSSLSLIVIRHTNDDRSPADGPETAHRPTGTIVQESRMETPMMVSDFAQSQSDAGTARKRRLSLGSIAYWTCTAIVAWEMVAGSMWDLLRIEFVRGVFDHLGYPHYLLLIIGAWKLPCAVALFVPRFARLKEWAYAGAIFNYTGAAGSHLLVGDGPSKWIVPLIFAAITFASWALRPPDRRLPTNPSPGTLRPAAWVVPLGVIVAFLVVALLTLPKGPPPP
jgi:DoxX-like family